MTPQVSAIIPTHNRAGLLEITLRTIRWQRDVSMEIIVVDDGSSDETSEVVEGLGDQRIRLLRHATPRGVSTARNTGAAEARAPWLAFCDDDDLWAPDKLTRQLAAAEDARRTWAYGGAVHVSIDLRVLNVKLPPPPEELVRSLPEWSLMPGGSSNVIVRAETFQGVGGWDPSLINLADWDLWARLASTGPPAWSRRPLVGYRIHPGNASADTGLILQEADVIDGRYGDRIDRGQLHHYLAWVYLRSGQRRPAVRHLVGAGVRGQLGGVARTLTLLARRGVGRWLPSAEPREPREHTAWRTEAEEWLARLREADVATT